MTQPPQIPTREEALAFLERDVDHNLALLGAMLFEPIEALYGIAHAGSLVALGIVVAPEVNIPAALPTVFLDAATPAALTALLDSSPWPQHATWTAHTSATRDALESWLARPPIPNSGVIYFGSDQPPPLDPRARQLGSDDMALDLTPCGLGTIALSYWMLRGWRVFGVVEGQRLLGHAVTAYPIADTEEVSAVFTAPEARRRGIASACAAAAIADITAHGKRAMYVSRKTNVGSIYVAEGLGMQRVCETWEFTMR